MRPAGGHVLAFDHRGRLGTLADLMLGELPIDASAELLEEWNEGNARHAGHPFYSAAALTPHGLTTRAGELGHPYSPTLESA